MAVSTASEFETPITFQMDVIAKPLNDQKQRCKLCYIVFALVLKANNPMDHLTCPCWCCYYYNESAGNAKSIYLPICDTV